MSKLHIITTLLFATSLIASSGPDSRTVTDPKSVISEANGAAKPVPIDDLFMTRSVSGAAWAPSGQEIVFESNASGRTNVWKMRADGEDAKQLTHSDERQFGAAWSPDGKWI